MSNQFICPLNLATRCKLRRLIRIAPALALIAGLSSPLLPPCTGPAQLFGADRLPLQRYLQPGTTGMWSAMQRPGLAEYSQPIRVTLPGKGTVTFFHGQELAPIVRPSPAQVGLRVGHLYRFKISNLEGLPGVELYPSIEMLDRLHPPAGRKQDFPMPVVFTAEEIDSALNGRLVTKVIFLEQPQLAGAPTDEDLPVRQLRPRENPLAEADRYGRPMAIVRLGNRIPDAGDRNSGFFGLKPPIERFTQPPVNEQVNNRSEKAKSGRSIPLVSSRGRIFAKEGR